MAAPVRETQQKIKIKKRRKQEIFPYSNFNDLASTNKSSQPITLPQNPPRMKQQVNNTTTLFRRLEHLVFTFITSASY